MKTAFEYSVIDALSCAVRQSEHGVIQGSWGYLAYLVAKEFFWSEKKVLPQLFDIDFDALFEDSRWVEVEHGPNNELKFYDKRRFCEVHYIYNHKLKRLFEVPYYGQ